MIQALVRPLEYFMAHLRRRERFEFALLQSASGLDEDDAADGVEELVRRRILEQATGDLEFTHDQIREALTARFDEPTLLRVADAYERETEWSKQPPPIPSR